VGWSAALDQLIHELARTSAEGVRRRAQTFLERRGELVDTLKRDKKVRNGIWLAIRVGVVGSWRRRPIAALGF